MSILDRIDGFAQAFNLTPKAKRTSQRPPWFTGQSSPFAFNTEEIPSADTYLAMADRYGASSPFYSAVNRIAEASAMSKCGVYNNDGDGAEAISNHPFISLLKKPASGLEWLSLDRFTVLESIAASLCIAGGAYIYLGARQRALEAPTMFLPLRHDRVTPVVDRNAAVTHYTYSVTGSEWQIPPSDIIYIKRYNPTNDYVGLSQTVPANYAISTDMASQKHNFGIFRRGIRASGVVESTSQNISLEQRRLMEKYWTDAFTGGPEKAHQILFLWDGFHFNDLGINARDAEYSEGRKQNLRDILMATGVHPAIMMQENSSKAGASAAEYLFAKYTLSPLLERIRQRINSEVMPSYGNGHDFRFIDVVPRDTIQATSANVAYLDRGVMLINEARTQIGLPRVDWGDVTWPELRAKFQTEMRGNAGSRDNQAYLDQNSQREVAREHNQMAGRTSGQRDRYDPYQT